MAFNTASFAFFFIFFLCVTFVTRGFTQKVMFTLLSYVFYASSGPAFVFLLFISTYVDYILGQGLVRSENASYRKFLLFISLAVNIGMLGFFKYAGFFSIVFNDVFGYLHIPIHLQYLDIPLPAGISFYCFHALSYTIDLYRKKIKPAECLTDFAFYMAFFPQLVAGPIVRAGDFLPQIKTYKPLVLANTVRGLEFIISGLAKKMIVADNLALRIDFSIGNLVQLSPANLFLLSMLFAVQIYCDFSGYTDVARGICKVLGFDLLPNFRWPYFSSTMQEFWRRWHMSLSFWFRDYLYIPLGGSRKGAMRRRLNLFITWLLCGLWHGAEGKFAVWGLFHGSMVELSRFWPKRPGIIWKAFSVAVTFYLTCIGWMIFRAPDVRSALFIIAKTLGLLNLVPILGLEGRFPVNPEHLGLNGYFRGFPFCGWDIVALVAVLAVIHYAAWRFDYCLEGKSIFSRLPYYAVVLITSIAFLMILFFMGPQEPFIYFQF